MCGVFFTSQNKPTDISVSKALLSIMHRGPDDMGEFYSELNDCKMGHVRLSILDISSQGKQPMVDSSGRYVISFNGEIYNYIELRRELSRNYQNLKFKTSTDTEVILEGFAREGKKFLSKLNGMFTFGIYDKRDKILFVLRDPLGIKPLFYTCQNDSYFFSSELKGLLFFGGFKKTLSLQSMVDQITYMFVPEPNTLYKEFKKFPRGALTQFQFGKKIKNEKIFEHLNKKINFSSDEEALKSFSTTFSSSVKRQQISDVPLSIMLSGGIDSSAVASEVYKNNYKMDAYTIRFRNEDIRYDHQTDDYDYAKLIAKKFNFKLNKINADINFLDKFFEISNFLEDGISDPAAINTYIISKKARENGIKVLLTGQGADEFLCGYRRYTLEKFFRNTPNQIKQVFNKISYFLPSNSRYFNSFVRRAKKFSSILGEENKFLRYHSLFATNDIPSIENLFLEKNSIEVGKEFKNKLSSLTNMHYLDEISYLDQNFDLISLNLAYTDRMSMAAGVEARVPFLDFELIRVMNSISSNLKLNKYISKYILKSTMKNKLPNNVINRNKTGFFLPIRSWLREENKFFKEYLDEDKIRKQGIFNYKTINLLKNEQFNNKKDNANTIISLMFLQKWLENNGY